MALQTAPIKMEVLDSGYVDENDAKADNSTPEVEEGALAVAIYEGGQKEGGNVDDMEDSGVFDGSALEDTSNIEVDSETVDEVMQNLAALSNGPPFAPIFVLANKKASVPCPITVGQLALPAPANHVKTTKSSIPNVAPVPSPGVLKEDNRLPAAKKQRMEYPALRAIAAMNRCTARHAQEGLTTAVLDEMAKVQKAVNIVEKMRKDLRLPLHPKPPLSPYNLFGMEKRDTVRMKKLLLGNKELHVERELGRMWRALNCDEKQVYCDRAQGLIQNDLVSPGSMA